MRDIDDSDIEVDLGEINTFISVKEAHSNGLHNFRTHSNYRDCPAAPSAWVPRDASSAMPIDAHLVSSAGHTAQLPGRMRGACTLADRDVRARAHAVDRCRRF